MTRMNTATINRTKYAKNTVHNKNNSSNQLNHHRIIIACVLILLTVVAIMFIYVYPIRAYYAETSKLKTEQHKLQILKEANVKMKKERTNLSKDSEIEKLAREQYHLIKPGEDAYIVTGK